MRAQTPHNARASSAITARVTGPTARLGLPVIARVGPTAAITSGLTADQAPEGRQPVGISSTIHLANQARDQLRIAAEACETSGDAVGRAIAVLGASEDTDGPLVASRQALTAWRDELTSVATELTAQGDELGRLAADLQSIQARLSPSGGRSER
jgi:hypothetical protein